MDLFLSLDGHDLEVEEYDLKLVAGVDAVRQRVDCSLRLFYGEWFLDDEDGMPYYRDVFIKDPQSRVIEALYRRQILADPQMERLTSFDMTIDKATRKLDVDWAGASSVGIVVASEVYP